LFDCASRAGGELLGLNVGALKVGEPADFFTLPVDSLAAAVFGQESVCDVAVQGKMIVRDGQHSEMERARSGFKKVVAEALS
jgi:cytosine/adenosine deaminase-related metal-dependent hydrolase